MEIKFRYVMNFCDEIYNFPMTLDAMETGEIDDEMRDQLANGGDVISKDIFTGYQDKNNKDVYLNDRLFVPTRDRLKHVIVTFDNGCFLIEGRLFEEFLKYNQIEVIGHINDASKQEGVKDE